MAAQLAGWELQPQALDPVPQPQYAERFGGCRPHLLGIAPLSIRLAEALARAALEKPEGG